MMKFFSILAIIFCGGTFWVGADYYMELRAPPEVTNFRGETSMTPYLYECKGVPQGTPAYLSLVSRCARVDSWEDKILLYYNCNFFRVHRLKLGEHVIHFEDRVFSMNAEWNLGLLKGIDHPDFGAPSATEHAYFRTKLQRLGVMNLGVNSVVPSYLIDGLVDYFAQNNLIHYSQDLVRADSGFGGFSTFLNRVMQLPADISRDSVRQRAEARSAKLEKAIQLCLQKIIDPCSVWQINVQGPASAYCATHCNFLSFAAQHFGTCTGRCSSLQGGQCEGVVCMCQRVMTNPLVGCDPITSPMRMCHNSLRSELNEK